MLPPKTQKTQDKKIKAHSGLPKGQHLPFWNKSFNQLAVWNKMGQVNKTKPTLRVN